MTNKGADETDSSEFLTPEFELIDYKDNTYSHAISNEQVKQLFGYCRLIAISNSLFAALFITFLWNTNNHRLLMGWFLLILCMSSIRLISDVLYQKKHRGEEDVSFWKNSFAVVTAVNSLIWGIGSVVFFPFDNVEQQYLLALFIFGLSSLGLSIYSVIPRVMFSLLLPSIVPFTIVLLLQHNSTSSLLAVGMVYAFVFFVFASRKAYKNTYENIYLRLKEVEQKKTIQLAKELIEKSSDAKSEFLSRMSHELRTPLNAILGFGQMLELDAAKMTNVQQENVAEILNAGQHLLNLINKVLDLSQIETGNLDISLETVSLEDSVNEAVTLLKTQAEQRQITISIHFKESGLCVCADPVRLKQVFVNLLSNAVKYNRQQGQIIVAAQCIDDGYVNVSISDTGEGLTEQQIQLLFVPFDRLHVASNIEGTGIGLVITRHLMTLMHGHLDVASTVGKGSVFSVKLPVVVNQGMS